MPAANLVGAEGDGFKIAMAGLDGGRLNIGACSLGGGQAALDKALAYMRERKAFGRRIADFQALQFRVADIATSLETARSMLWRAASALDAKAPDATRLCAMAKRVATDAGFNVANDALQLFGGYGYLADYGVEKLVRDLRVHQILEGTNEIMRVIVARGLIERLDAPSITEGSHDDDRLHRPRQHGRPDGRQSRQGGPCGRRLRSRRGGEDAAAAAGVAIAAERARGGRRRRCGRHHAAGRQACAGGLDATSCPPRRRARWSSTARPSTSTARKRAHEAGAAAGALTLDAPVSGGVGGATAGTLTFMCGGSDEAFARPSRSSRRWASASSIAAAPGAGQAAKICNNMILGATMIATCEAFVLAEKLGLSRAGAVRRRLDLVGPVAGR